MKQPQLKYFYRVLAALVAVLVLSLSYLGFIYAVSPEAIRQPLLEHYHFRMQLVVDDKAVNFADDAFQEGYSKDQCNALLPEHPIHFHDNQDQFVHIHWEGMTGGLVMKYYGWDYFGGPDSVLGYRFDDRLVNPKKVPIHGEVLPAVPAGAHFYVYTGDETGHQRQNFDDWKYQDLEEFFGTASNFPAHQINMEKRKTGWLDRLFPPAYAHGGEDHSGSTASQAGDEHETETERLTRINNLLGNVVIFVQTEQPTDQQIKDRFSKLLPLTDSTCGG